MNSFKNDCSTLFCLFGKLRIHIHKRQTVCQGFKRNHSCCCGFRQRAAAAKLTQEASIISIFFLRHINSTYAASLYKRYVVAQISLVDNIGGHKKSGFTANWILLQIFTFWQLYTWAAFFCIFPTEFEFYFYFSAALRLRSSRKLNCQSMLITH